MDADEWDSPLLSMLGREITRDEPGQEAVLDRLLDLLLVAVLRAWLSRHQAEAPGWYRAQGDPVVGKALPIIGLVAYLDHNWSSRWSTSGGYSMVDIDNTNGQTSDAYHKGHYGSVNLLHTPVPNVMMGGEFQWARRENFGQFQVNDWRAQFSFKYSFSQKIGG